MMAGIRGRDTQPELLVRRYLHSNGFRFRLHAGSLPGRPDIVLPKYRIAIFVNGCFWHQHRGCRLATTPGTNARFWRRKLEANVIRDAHVRAMLATKGWRTIDVWECGLSDLSALPDQIRRGLAPALQVT
jgi:DNA mismatch endonuclease (patch repair protein)